jgi:hypothetical protein
MQVALWECSIDVMDASQKDAAEGGHDRTRFSSIGSGSALPSSESARRSSIGSEEADSCSDSNVPQSKKRRRSSIDETSSTLQERWDEMFDRLRAYKDANGNCNVPNR